MQLVLRVLERVRTGPHDDPVGLERPQVLGRHVLVVEGEHVAALGEAAQRLEVVLGPDVGRGVDGTTWAALSAGSRASTRSVMPSSIAGPAIIRASCPPPTTPTTGKPPGPAAAATRATLPSGQRPRSRAISIRCTSEVPSPISRILASRHIRATGNSFMKP